MQAPLACCSHPQNGHEGLELAGAAPPPHRVESGPGISTLHSRGSSWCQLPWRWPFASDILVRLRRTELLCAMGNREGTNERPQVGKIPSTAKQPSAGSAAGSGIGYTPRGTARWPSGQYSQPHPQIPEQYACTRGGAPGPSCGEPAGRLG